MEGRPSRRVKLVRADLQSLPTNRCLARVELERPAAGNFVGSSVAACPDTEGLRAAARAAAEALVFAAGPGRHELKVHDVEPLKAFGRSAVMVHLSARQGDKSQALMGLCLVGTNPAHAAALAVLNATNRFFDLG